MIPEICIYSCLLAVAFSLPAVLNTQDPDIGYFWHVTDFHYDFAYSMKGDIERMCHEKQGKGSSKTMGPFGEFACDSPKALIKSAIEAMAIFKSDPDFILWTGDNSPHNFNPSPNWTEVYMENKAVSLYLNQYFQNTLILPSLGNHDTSPASEMPVKNTSVYLDFINKGGYNLLLPNNTLSSFEHGGFYSTTYNKTLRLISLNTILWYRFNSITKKMQDPEGQFKWLEEELKEAQSQGQKVYLLGHVSPGFPSRAESATQASSYFYPALNDKMVHLLLKYSSVISGQFYGHQHRNLFILISNGSDHYVGSAHLSGSVTPWGTGKSVLSSSVNPSIRLFKYNRKTFQLLDYTQYYLNLTKANSNSQASNRPDHHTLWEFMYNFTEAYGVDSADTPSLVTLFQKLQKQPDVFDKYYHYTTSLKVDMPCKELCHATHLCSIAYVTDKYRQCLEDSINNTSMEIVAEARKHLPDLHPDHEILPHITDHGESSSTTLRDVLIGCSVSAVFVVFIVVAVRIKRSRMMSGPRYANFH